MTSAPATQPANPHIPLLLDRIGDRRTCRWCGMEIYIVEDKRGEWLTVESNGAIHPGRCS